ncbi:MAG: hypothetical protein ACTH0V_18730, partial [Microbacteriaceae bacterium]
VTTRDINQGLTLDSYGDRVVVTAYDFATDEQLRQVEIANPLVAFDADVRPAPEDPDPETPDPENPEPENPEPETPGNPGGGSGDTGSGSGEAENPSADDESASGDLATTGADLPWGLGLAAGALVLGGLGLALRARRNA